MGMVKEQFSIEHRCDSVHELLFFAINIKLFALVMPLLICISLKRKCLSSLMKNGSEVISDAKPRLCGYGDVNLPGR